jgi:predicted amidohydrolase
MLKFQVVIFFIKSMINSSCHTNFKEKRRKDKMKYLAACIQLCAKEDQDRNLAYTAEQIRRAASYGARLVITPENTPFLGPQFHKIEKAESLEGGICQFFAALAQELSIYLVIGSIAEAILLPSGALNRNRCYNTSVVFNPKGERIGFYRKIHLFDVDVPQGPSIKESDFIEAGDTVVVVPTELGNIGLSICYDLRFPALYAQLVKQGADLITVPSAFTLTTGKDHWHALLRARAIETQCWVLAPGQWGQHDEKGQRQSYGHSLIVDPWGNVSADKGQGEGICLAEIDLDRITQVRKAIPVQAHKKLSF